MTLGWILVASLAGGALSAALAAVSLAMVIVLNIVFH